MGTLHFINSLKYRKNLGLSPVKRILPAILVVSLMVSTETLAGCKFFTTCGFTPNQPVAGIISDDKDCISVDNIPATTDVNGCVTYRVCCENIIITCEASVRITVNTPNGAEVKTVPYKCKKLIGSACAEDEALPVVEGCVEDICTAGGDSREDAIDVTACAVDESSSPVSILITIALSLLIAAIIYIFWRRSRKKQ